MKKRESELIVKTVLAGMASKHAIADIDSRKQLRKYGIDRVQSNKLKKRLLLTLSGEETTPDSEGFHAALKITPTSTVAAIAAQLPKAYKELLPAGAKHKEAFEFKGNKSAVEIAVCTALAQNSRKYSVLQIKPTMDLAVLGLDQSGIAKAKTHIYKTFSGTKPRVKHADFIRSHTGKKPSTVNDLLHTMSLSGDGPTKPRG